MSEELKACPFCGCEARYERYNESTGRVACSKCGSHTPTGTKQFFIKSWNTRQPDKKLVDALEKIKANAGGDCVKCLEIIDGYAANDLQPRQPEKELVDAFDRFVTSIAENVSIEYMDEMLDGGMTEAIEALTKYRENK